MAKIFSFILLAGGCVYFVWYALNYMLGLIDKEEMSCFGSLNEGGYRGHQKYDGFSILTDTDYDCPPLIKIPVTSEGKEENLYILPKARGIQKVKYPKYSFLNRDKDFTLKKEVYERIRATISLSKEVDEFLASHVEENRHGK